MVSMDTPGHMISDVSEGSGEVNEPIKLKRKNIITSPASTFNSSN